jgi:predicted HicB family RNase H-like nuclease
MQSNNVLNTNSSGTSVTFRLDQDNVKKLRSQAQKEGISFNSLVNQALKGFLA